MRLKCDDKLKYYLCCNVGILFSVAIAVVGVEVVTSYHTINRLEHHATVVVRDHISVSVEDEGLINILKYAFKLLSALKFMVW